MILHAEFDRAEVKILPSKDGGSFGKRGSPGVVPVCLVTVLINQI